MSLVVGKLYEASKLYWLQDVGMYAAAFKEVRK
jgi:hypothetical protein